MSRLYLSSSIVNVADAEASAIVDSATNWAVEGLFSGSKFASHGSIRDEAEDGKGERLGEKHNDC